MEIKECFISTLKSARLQNVHSLLFNQGAIVGDREFMLYDMDQSRFMSLRHYPQMARIEQLWKRDKVTFYFSNSKDNSSCLVSLNHSGNSIGLPVFPHNEVRHCITQPEQYSRWFAERLHVNCMLVKQDTTRLKMRESGDHKMAIALHDSSSCHVVTKASLNWLRCSESLSLTITRFRPNIVIDTEDDTPFVEETWIGKVLRIGEQRFVVRNRTARCGIPYLNPETALIDWLPKSKLEERRKDRGEDKIYFGIYIFPIAASDFMIHGGERVIVE